MCKKINMDRVMRWRLILEEYIPELCYIKDEHNIVTDELSHLDMVQDPLTMDRQLTVIKMADLFTANDGNFPADFPLSYAEIEQRQKNEARIRALLLDPDKCQLTDFRFGDLTYKVVAQGGKILLPASLQSKAVNWYHDTLIHPGQTRMELTMG